eukprot:COSAG04_NODE_12366_length_656_cov_1.224417_1_plen_21_part_10
MFETHEGFWVLNKMTYSETAW